MGRGPVCGMMTRRAGGPAGAAGSAAVPRTGSAATVLRQLALERGATGGCNGAGRLREAALRLLSDWSVPQEARAWLQAERRRPELRRQARLPRAGAR